MYIYIYTFIHIYTAYLRIHIWDSNHSGHILNPDLHRPDPRDPRDPRLHQGGGVSALHGLLQLLRGRQRLQGGLRLVDDGLLDACLLGLALT